MKTKEQKKKKACFTDQPLPFFILLCFCFLFFIHPHYPPHFQRFVCAFFLLHIWLNSSLISLQLSQMRREERTHTLISFPSLSLLIQLNARFQFLSLPFN
mmetsp:Transcript_22829/g.46955  ORF Transcript_22829/g.46955 Transcript_22829/m.46955 type:complete len:100 (+) Transcript_22829:803-1102(+)